MCTCLVPFVVEDHEQEKSVTAFSYTWFLRKFLEAAAAAAATAAAEVAAWPRHRRR